MRVNIDGPSLDNFDTEKFVSDCIESPVTSRHLMAIIHLQQKHMKKLMTMVLFYKGKT